MDVRRPRSQESHSITSFLCDPPWHGAPVVPTDLRKTSPLEISTALASAGLPAGSGQRFSVFCGFSFLFVALQDAVSRLPSAFDSSWLLTQPGSCGWGHARPAAVRGVQPWSLTSLLTGLSQVSSRRCSRGALTAVRAQMSSLSRFLFWTPFVCGWKIS